MGHTLYKKVWDAHIVATLPTGQTQLFIGLHLVHEVTSPQAFDMLREKGLSVAYPDRTFATPDHIVPTKSQTRPFADAQADTMLAALERNARESNFQLFGLDDDRQGIVHIIGPELGLTQPGITLACGDSHTSTHGAFGSLAFGIGTTQVRDVLATQTLALDPLKVRRINVTGALPLGVGAKDVILAIIRRLGVDGGKGFAYEYGGPVIDAMSMEERMTVCNMSIEGGARIGYVNPDTTTVEYLRGRPFAPAGEAFDRAREYWNSIVSDPDAIYDDIVEIDGSALEPTVTWGVTPGQSIGITEILPDPASFAAPETAVRAYKHMGLEPGKPIAGAPIQVAFLGSCTNGRISDFREAARILKGRRVSTGVRALAVPGSREVKAQAEQEGLDKIFIDAGFEWRNAGCSMCLAMNPDKLVDDELCASSSNRNFIGRQGSIRGRTVLMSPAMVAAAAVTGSITDVRALMESTS